MRTFTGSIAVTDFASKDNAGSVSPREKSLSTLQVFGLETPLKSPPIQSRRERTKKKFKRSSSAPHRHIPFGKPSRRSTFEVSPPPSKFQTSHREIQTQDDGDSVSQLRKEVIALLILITRADESPLQRSKAAAPRRPKSVDLHTLLATECPSETPALPAVSDRSQDHPRKRDFDSLEWFRQKNLLNRELKRLLSWNLEASTSAQHEDTTQIDQGQIVADAFASIGKALIERESTQPWSASFLLNNSVLADDMLYEGCVARIERLIRNIKHGVLTNEDSHGEQEDSPFDRIQTAINYLFEPEPLRRKNMTLSPALVAPSMQTSILPNHIGVEGPAKKAQKVDHLHIRQKPRFALGDEDEDLVISDSPNTDPTQEKSIGQAQDAATPSSSADSHADEDGIERKIVLEIADRLDAFQKRSDVRQSKVSAGHQTDERPQIKRLTSSEFPREPSEISAVIDSLAKMSITSQFSSTAITNELLKLARTKREPLWVDDSSQILGRFDQILGLTATLPSWNVYICADYKQQEHAKSAMSLIYFSLLEEAVSCAVSASEALQEELNDGDVSEVVQWDAAFFCACIQRLSGVQQSVKGTFDAFQPQLDRLVSKLELLDTLNASMPCAASPDDATSTNASSCTVDDEDATAPAYSRDDILYHEYEPLALACYLSASGAGRGSVSSSDEGVLDHLEAMSVKSLFGLADAKTNEQAISKAH